MNNPTERTIKVLVVEDSPFMRKAIEKILQPVEHIEVIGSARNGLEALEMIKRKRPDVITLDIQMPVMDGLETLRAIMSDPKPIPCVMVSSLTTDGAEITLTALEEGAIDFITKPSSLLGTGMDFLEKELTEKITVAAKILPFSLKTRMLRKKTIKPAVSPISAKKGVEVVLIGLSTGGPMALQQLIPQLPEDFPAAVVIAQHMPPGFTKSLADRLNKKSKIEVKEAEEGDIVLPKRVLLARAGAHLKFMEKFRQKIVRITLKPHNEPYSPSVNVLYESATIFGRNSLPVIMTGMGTDGTRGLKELKKHNVRTLAQSEKTCAVFGMPKSAINEGLIDRVVDLEGMAKAIIWEI